MMVDNSSSESRSRSSRLKSVVTSSALALNSNDEPSVAGSVAADRTSFSFARTEVLIESLFDPVMSSWDVTTTNSTLKVDFASNLTAGGDALASAQLSASVQQ
ncbi:MAG: hypothetical protein WD066_19225 [Planctomycetaceae bacterium]